MRVQIGNQTYCHFLNYLFGYAGNHDMLFLNGVWEVLPK